MGLRSPVFLAVECRGRRRLAGESGSDHYLSPDYAGGLCAGLPPSQLTSNPCTRPDRPAEATLAIQKACCCLPRGRRLVPAFSAIHPQGTNVPSQAVIRRKTHSRPCRILLHSLQRRSSEYAC